MGELDAFYQEVGRLVRSARNQAGLTQDILAERVALSRTSVTNIERGRQKMLLHTLRDIAEAVGIEASELLPKGPTEKEARQPQEKAGDQEADDASVIRLRKSHRSTQERVR